MAIFTDKKDPVLVDEGKFHVSCNGSLYVTTSFNEVFEFHVNKVSITLTVNPENGGRHPKHFTGYTSVMYDKFYEYSGCGYIEEANFEWYVRTLKDEGTVDRTERMEYIKNFKMKMDINCGEVPVWRIDFDYGNA